jgi:hypothetical protein
MKLPEAFLCIDCDEVFIAKGNAPRCPSCGSSAHAPLSRWVKSMEGYEREQFDKAGEMIGTRCPEVCLARAINL